MCIHYFSIISPWEWVWPFVSSDLNFLCPSMLCIKLVVNGPVALEKILKCRHCVFSMSILSPLGEERGPSSNLNFLLPKMFCTSLIETGLWFWRWKCKKFTDRQIDNRRLGKLWWNESTKSPDDESPDDDIICLLWKVVRST